MAFRIEHRLGVQAPAAEVWALVSNLEGWKDWTGLYTHASGRLAIGEKLSFTFALPGEAHMSAVGIVQDWVPEHQMIWKVNFPAGLFHSIRYVEIEALGPESCILANGDLYRGFGARFIPRSIRRKVHAGFEAMNDRAKTLTEASWAIRKARGDAAPGPYLPPAPDKPAVIGPTVVVPRYWGLGAKKAGQVK